MKVLDIITEGVGNYVWKYFGKQSLEHSVARETVENIATQIFNNYTKKGIKPPEGIVQDMLIAHPSHAGLDDATKQKIKREISEYHNYLVDEFKKSGLTPKPKKDGAAEVAKGAVGTAWAKLQTIGLLNTVFIAWAAKDIYDIVSVYHENMLEAIAKLESKDISLEAFHMYHKEQLTQLVAQLILTKPARFWGVPILGWAGRVFNSGGAGRVAWLAFIDTKIFDGPEGKLSVRNYIDNFCLWKLRAIPLIGPLFGDTTIADVVGEKLKWGEDVVMEAWVNFLKNTFYKGQEVPASLLPPSYVGPSPSNPEDKKKYGPPDQGGKVGPADADAQAGANVAPNNSAVSADKNWKDLGNGFDANIFTGAIRVSPGTDKK